MKLQTIFGSNVRHHRRALGLTLEQLSEAVGVSRETIGKIERGTSAPLFETAERIAAALEVSPPSLFSGESELSGERGRLLSSIHVMLAALSDTQLAKFELIVKAYVDK